MRIILSFILFFIAFGAYETSAQTYDQSRGFVTLNEAAKKPWLLQMRPEPAPVRRFFTSPSGRDYPAEQSTQSRSTYSAPAQPVLQQPRRTAPRYAAVQPRPPEPKPQLDPRFLPQIVDYDTPQKPGTLVIDTNSRHLYLVMENGKAKRYGVGVGKPGFEWAGTHKVTRKAEWPDWRPPAEMIAREKKKGRTLPSYMPGGPQNPLGARALYLGSTLYRIHGSNEPWSIGQAVSSGCIRMRNEDVMDLYERVKLGTKVVVI
jgi:lipoprotein-anchoring transpeptidase ErfK/SrfK